MTHRLVELSAALLLLSASACATTVRRFPARTPMARDDDMRPWGPMPEEYVSPMVWDGADKLLFTPLTNVFWLPVEEREAIDVNALDEVVDSSWYTNRRLTPAQAARGFCSQDIDTAGPWTIKSGKPNGVNPGFIFKTADGRRFVLKTDGLDQPERPTAADTIGSRLYYAAGYHTACNRVVYFDPEILRIADDATSEEGGEEVPFAQRHIDAVVQVAAHGPGGTIRASISEFLPGRPLGPFRYVGTRDDDPNDVVAHQHRRELRANYLLAALTNHFDCREQNTLDIWRETGPGLGYIEHHMLDWGDSFGSLFDPREIARKLGYSHYFDLPQAFANLASLGAIRRPWEGRGEPHPRFGTYDVAHFDADGWRPSYPNPAMAEMTERDAHWMARKLAEIGVEHLRAIVREGQFSDPRDAKFLFRALEGRRRKLLERYLLRWTPLSRPRAEGRDLCFDDMATIAGLTAPLLRPMTHRVTLDGRTLPVRADGEGKVCATVPAGRGYRVATIEGHISDEVGLLPPVEVHLVDRGPGGLLVAGVQR